MGVINLAFHAAGRRWRNRQQFVGNKDWLATLYDAVVRYFDSLPFPFRGCVWPIRVGTGKSPAYIRIGASDGAILEELYIRHVYQCVTSTDLGAVQQVLDLGANIGLSVKLWAEHYPDARIIAIEPDETNIELCRRNIAEFSDRVVVLRACVAALPGQVYLQKARDECAHRMVRAATVGKTIPVEAVTISQILNTHGKPGLPIDLLKVDIEGAEEEVFSDCRGWIGLVRHLMIELHGQYTREMLLRDLSTAGSNLKLIDSRIVSGNPLLFFSGQ